MRLFFKGSMMLKRWLWLIVFTGTATALVIFMAATPAASQQAAPLVAVHVPASSENSASSENGVMSGDEGGPTGSRGDRSRGNRLNGIPTPTRACTP